MVFLAETEKAFYDGMRRFIKDDLKCQALVTGTIVFGPLGLWAQSDMDYIDAHAYWQHPRFPGRPWDPGNWLVNQKAMVDHPEESPLFGLAASRLAGKPFTVSEYNHPAPNDYQAECVPMVASFAAAQDWDGVWLFAYSHRADQWDRGHFSSFFDIQANPAKWGLVPAGTMIFREGGIPPLAAENVIPLAERESAAIAQLAAAQAVYGRDMMGLLRGRGPFKLADWLNTRWSVTIAGERKAGRVTGKRLKWFSYDHAPFGVSWLFRAKSVRAEVEAGVLVAGQGSLPFHALTITPLDDQPLNASRRILVTVCSRCENTGMKFSEDRRTVGRNWGKAPVRIEPYSPHDPLVLRFAPPEEGMRCYALRPDGTKGKEVLVEGKGDRWIHISARDKTMWYLLVREEKEADTRPALSPP
jgi:hypothetical protein